MTYIRIICLAFICLAYPAYAGEAIAVWAFPDWAPVTGTVRIGVAAYHASGIDRVDFDTDGGTVTAVTAETKNPDTGEYEFVYTVNTAGLTDTLHKINATAYPKTGTGHVLPDLRIDVVNAMTFTVRYADGVNGSDETGDGSDGNPYASIKEALNNSTGGDTVKVRTGTYTFPSNWDQTFTRFVMIMPDDGADPVITDGEGTMRKGFLKVSDLTWDYRNGDNGAWCHSNYTSPYFWFSGCRFLGVGKEDPNNGQTAFRVYYDGGHYTIENCYIEGMNRAFVVGGAGRNIIRNCEVNALSSDAFNPGEEMLISGNKVYDIKAPNMFLENGVEGPVDVSANNELYINHCEFNSCDSADYAVYHIPDLGAQAANSVSATLEEVAAACNAVTAFYEKMWAEVKDGRLRLYARRTNYVQHLWVNGSGNTALQFAANSYANEESGAGAHSDILQYWGSSSEVDTFSNFIFRNNACYNNYSQGIFPGADYHSLNVAFVNNLVDAASKGGWNVNFAGSRNPGENFENVLFEFNTIWDKGQAFLFSYDSAAVEVTVRNNIFGRRALGAGDRTAAGFDMDYNYWISYYAEPTNVAAHSIYQEVTLEETGDLFTFCIYDSATEDDTSDFVPNENSPVRDAGTGTSGIIYDINWELRDGSPDMGAFEYRTSVVSDRCFFGRPAVRLRTGELYSLIGKRTYGEHARPGISIGYDASTGTLVKILILR